jgi:hypothetical protein
MKKSALGNRLASGRQLTRHKYQVIGWAEVVKGLSIGWATDGDLPEIPCLSGGIVSGGVKR